MISPEAGRGVQVWLATTPVDMRKSFDGLSELPTQRPDPVQAACCGHLDADDRKQWVALGGAKHVAR